MLNYLGGNKQRCYDIGLNFLDCGLSLTNLFVLLLVLSNNFQYGLNDDDFELATTAVTAKNKISLQMTTNLARMMRNSNIKVTALVDKSVTLTCSIELDDKEFSKNENYEVIWSRESDNGKDYDPLALEVSRLVPDTRIIPTRLVINKPIYDQIQWSLVINNLKPSDTKSYICQLNRHPYNTFWLKRFMLNVYEPPSFLDEINTNETNPLADYENSIFVKSVNEYDDFRLKCNSKGRPKPVVTWFLRYLNGTQIQLHIDSNEIVIKSIKKTSRIDVVECQVSNGYGATVTRSFKINIKHRPYMHTKPKVYRVPVRTHEIKLNCSVNANPMPQIQWYFLSEDHLKLNHNRIDDEGSSSNAITTPHTNTNNNNYDDIELSSSWKSINSVASYSFKYVNTVTQTNLLSETIRNSTFSIVKLPLSKYQIHEKRNVNHISSTLEIKLINEKDFGLYRCYASNDLGNKSVDFKLHELSYEAINSEKMRSLLSREKEKSKINDVDRTSEDSEIYIHDDEDHEDDVRESNYYVDKINEAPSSRRGSKFLCVLLVFWFIQLVENRL